MLRRMRALLAQLAGPRPPIAAAPGPAAPLATPLPDDRATLAAEPELHQPEVDRVVDLAPSSVAWAGAEATLDEVRRLVTTGAINQALALVGAALRAHPDPDIATALHELETIQRASKRLRRRPQDAMAHFELGRALFAQEQGAQALEHLDHACRLRPGWVEAHLLRAYELHWQSRWHEAEAAYTAVLTLDPTHAAARRGLLAVRICQPPEALLYGLDPSSGGIAAG